MADMVDVNKTFDELQTRLRACSTAKEKALADIAAYPQKSTFLSRWLLSSQFAQIQDASRKSADSEEADCTNRAVRYAKELITIQREYEAQLAAPNKAVEQSQARTIKTQDDAINKLAAQRDFLADVLGRLLSTIPSEPPPQNRSAGTLVASATEKPK